MSKDIFKEVDVELPALKAPQWIQGFVNFIREQGVVGVAVGLILGLSIKSVADSLVANIINPLIRTLGSGDSITNSYVCLNTVDNACQNKLAYGALLGDLLSFVVIAAAVYFIVKGLRLDKLDKKSK